MNLVSEAIDKYIDEHATSESDVLKQLTRETHLKVQMPQMLSGHIQGLFLSMFSKMLQPKTILEIGTFTGYSGICLAEGLAENGKLITIDKNEELRPMCEKYFSLAGLTEKVELLSGDATSIIPSLKETFDLVFIDADKLNYSIYLDLVFDKVRTGGFIIADNVLWSGKVVDEKKDKDTQAIDNYNKKVKEHPGLKSFILPLRDGLNIAQKVS
jgi:predicted O-methyltransferase YrrM